MDWFDLLEVWGILKSLLQHHSSKASILWCSAFFIVQLSHPYMTTRKTIALTRCTFAGNVMSLLFNMLSRLIITFLPKSKRLLILWLQSPPTVILEPPPNKVCHCFPIYLPWSDVTRWFLGLHKKFFFLSSADIDKYLYHFWQNAFTFFETFHTIYYNSMIKLLIFFLPSIYV